MLLYSVDFAEIEVCQSSGDWNKSADILASAAISLEKAGADFVLICTNTMHKVAPQIQQKINIPIIHIAQVAAEELIKNNITKTALLGTKYTMQQDFYNEKLIEAGIDVLIPDDNDMEFINHVIYDELCHGVISDDSKAELLRIIDKLADKGAKGVVLGCTEIGLLIKQEDTPLPVFDTALIHAAKAAMLAIGK